MLASRCKEPNLMCPSRSPRLGFNQFGGPSKSCPPGCTLQRPDEKLAPLELAGSQEVAELNNYAARQERALPAAFVPLVANQSRRRSCGAPAGRICLCCCCVLLLMLMLMLFIDQ